MSVIKTEKLTKYYDKVVGIKDLDLTVEDGEILGFIGPNGAGKSTTIRVLLSLIYASSGSATIFGKDVVQCGQEIKNDIGYLPSEVFYYDNMTVKSFLEYSARFYKKDCTQRINELSDILKLNLSKKIEDLSYGNKKKVGIVQGLLHNPKLIILDEPTGGLDPLIQKNFFELLKEENNNGTTIFFSSHILSEVQKLCHRVAIIKEGELIKIESMSSLRKDNYKRLHLQLNGEVNNKLFSFDGVSDLMMSESKVSFLYKGNVNQLMQTVSSADLTDITIEEPTLEEIFMHYYQ